MNWFKKKRIYLDYASATPLLKDVEEVMKKYWSRDFHNPGAIYDEGISVRKDIEGCRTRIARILSISSKGIVFTGSGTESLNLAILGAFSKAKETIEKPHLIISSIEHPAVMAVAREIERLGGETSICPVNEEGIISLEELRLLLKPNTFMVSVGLANSEIGTVQPISKIGRIVRAYRKENNSLFPYFHTDASQASSYIDVALEKLQVDLLTLDASKIYGPKGIGILAFRGGVKINPIIFGGGQEGGLRSGTPSPALISGLTVAFEQVTKEREKEVSRINNLREVFVKSVKENIPEAVINGSEVSYLPNIVSVSIPGTLSEFILLKLDKEGVMVSVGTACSLDERVSGSPVLRAIGKPELAESTLRFSFGRFTTEKDINKAMEIFSKVSS